jgi:4-amino-4-deoxy-L-arabinose transferase-like glycosyltransferase
MLAHILANIITAARGHLKNAGNPAGTVEPVLAAAPARWPANLLKPLYVWLAILLPVFYFFRNLGIYPLRDNNEGLYAEIAREMLETGNFIIPHLDGVPYIEKPPLLYWLMALSMSLFGQSAASARLASAGAMFCLTIAMFVFCRRFGSGRPGIYSCLILSSAVPAVLVSRSILFDPLLTALLGGCLLSFLLWYEIRSRRWLFASALLLALAVLAKGGIALVMAGGVVCVFLLLMRDRQAWRGLADPVAIALFMTVTVPWHVAAAYQQEGFSWYYFINEHVLRFLGLREPHDFHTGPLYYYLPRVLIMLFPWTPFLLLLIRSCAARDPALKMPVRFCQAWVLFPLLFFSASQAKAQYYILVSAPALVIWLGMEIDCRLRNGYHKALARCWGASFASGALALWLAFNFDSISWTSPAGVVAFLSPMLLYAGLAHWFGRLKNQSRLCEFSLVSTPLLIAPLLTALLHIADDRSLRDSSWHVAQAIEARGIEGAKVFLYREFEDVFSSLPFYLGRKLKVIDSASKDLLFGCGVAPAADNACISSADFIPERESGPVAVVVKSSDADAFRGSVGPYPWRIVMIGQKWIFFNRPSVPDRATGRSEHADRSAVK